jgi:ATP-dependent DNA helicase RecG
MHEKLQPGSEFIFFGKPSAFNGRINMVHPEVDPVPSMQDGVHGTAAGSMTGVYNSTEKIKNSGITGKVMTKIMSAAVDRGLPAMEETLPEYIMKQYGLVPLHFAVRNIHFPKDLTSLEKSKYRLKFEELFYLQLSLLKQKYVRSRSDQGIPMTRVGEAFNNCYNALPFPLTGAQKRVITEIRNDMKSGHQMNRLLQGDVGSGKTMVAVLTALIAIGNGFQACIMAPTEVLAQQHYKNIQKFLAPTGVKSALLTGSSKTSERREVHQGLEDGSIGIIVGTHALIEDNVIFKNLGLVIIDEQHRFGVEQRSKLWRKASCGVPPHVLVMTATPIPRTLAMTLYGDLDVSVIDELPPGRKPVQTIHATEGKRPALYKFMRDQIALGRQIFVVYPLINETEKLDYQSLEAGAEDIFKHFPESQYKTAVVH